ncbi:MAG: hypothetical protein IKW06_01610 [Clostridia bacterium]|nr:hypothetical protein [Clostridia bacterium]
MFGYIKIDKNELKVKDYNLFKAYYCGVCRTLKKEYGFPAHYFLSYDAAFLATLLTAFCKDMPAIAPTRCMVNPMVKRPVAQTDSCLSYAAAVNVLLTFFKLKDDWQDNHSLKAAFLMLFMVRQKKKAQKRYPVLAQGIRENLLTLSSLEKARCDEPDKVAASFGKLMADIFTVDFAEEEQRRVLSHTGFLLGRFIYLIDAWEDREKDERKKTYNPYLLAKEISEADTKLSLEYTLSQLAHSLQLLELERNKEIIDNVIYLGLKNVLDQVFSGEYKEKKTKKEKLHERPI